MYHRNHFQPNPDHVTTTYNRLKDEQQKELDEQKARTTKIEAMLAESRGGSGGSKGMQPTASPVEVPPPAPSGGAAMSEKSSQLSESKRMESAADTGDMVNNTTNNVWAFSILSFEVTFSALQSTPNIMCQHQLSAIKIGKQFQSFYLPNRKPRSHNSFSK